MSTVAWENRYGRPIRNIMEAVDMAFATKGGSILQCFRSTKSVLVKFSLKRQPTGTVLHIGIIESKQRALEMNLGTGSDAKLWERYQRGHLRVVHALRRDHGVTCRRLASDSDEQMPPMTANGTLRSTKTKRKARTRMSPIKEANVRVRKLS